MSHFKCDRGTTTLKLNSKDIDVIQYVIVAKMVMRHAMIGEKKILFFIIKMARQRDPFKAQFKG